MKGSGELASRRARAIRTSANRTIESIVRDVRAAVAQVHGDREAIILRDEDALGLYASFVTSNARGKIRDLTAYMAGIFGDAPEMDSFLANSTPVCLRCGQWEDECSCAALLAA